jgi:hypothetical protein
MLRRMAKQRVQFEVARPANQVHELCRGIVSERGWHMDELTATGMSARTGTAANLVKAAPIAIRISLAPGTDATAVTLDGSWPMKFGTWANRDIMARLIAFRETLEFEATKTAEDNCEGPQSGGSDYRSSA